MKYLQEFLGKKGYFMKCLDLIDLCRKIKCTQNQTWRRYAKKMKIINFTALFLGISMTSLSQNPEEIAFLMDSRNVINHTTDEEAIKAVCMKETQSFFNRNADGMIDCHANKSYSLTLVADGSNVYYTKAKSELENEVGMREMLKTMGPYDGETFVNSGYLIHINGTSAFIYYDQVVTTKDGIKTNTHEVRNLEKMDGKWKIFYVGAVKFNPEAK